MQARLLTSVPAVGRIVALTYASAIDDPARFKSSKQAGAHFGLTPKKHQSGETNYTGRISKIGDASVRTALYEAANVMLDQASQRLFATEELGHANETLCRHEQSQGGAGAPARGDHASNARRRSTL